MKLQILEWGHLCEVSTPKKDSKNNRRHATLFNNVFQSISTFMSISTSYYLEALHTDGAFFTELPKVLEFTSFKAFHNLFFSSTKDCWGPQWRVCDQGRRDCSITLPGEWSTPTHRILEKELYTISANRQQVSVRWPWSNHHWGTNKR